MFDLNPKRRITFAEIREHPVFSPHFPEVNQSPRLLYERGLTVIDINEDNA